jgi:FkbM family methyltransferase
MIIYNEPNAYDTISRDIENNFHNHINKSKEDIKTIVVVGGYICSECVTFFYNYPNAIIHIFEPVPEFFNTLVQRFGSHNRFKLYNLAVSNVNGIIDFYRTSSSGSDSILKVIENNNSGYNFNTTTSIKVKSVRLQDIIDEQIDLLSIDVQGAELEVLKGTNLNNVSSLFLEIQMSENKHQSVYENQCFMDDLKLYLDNKFKLHSIGLDNELNNGTGNSFWVVI